MPTVRPDRAYHLGVAVLRGICLIGILLAGCSSSDVAVVDTTAAANPASPVVVAVPAFELGVDPVTCVLRLPPSRVGEWMLDNLSESEVPNTFSNSVLRSFAAEHPEVASKVCDGVGAPPGLTDPLTSEREEIHREAAASYWTTAFESVDTEYELGELSEHNLADAALVWCNAHWGDVVDAADVLGIGLDDTPEIPMSLTVAEEGSDYATEWYVGDFASLDIRFAAWFANHLDWVARSCLAAFEAR